MEEKQFTKYVERGNCHWEEEFCPGIKRFNLVQHARFLAVLEQLPAHVENILDWGCGDGALSRHLLDRCNAFTGVDTEQAGLDFFEKNLSDKKEKYRLIKLEYSSPYQAPSLVSSSFDVIVCSDVIEHVQFPEALLHEFNRLLKPGGTLVITTPYRLTEEPNDPMHVKEYYPKELKQLVERCIPYADTSVTLYQKVLFYSLYACQIRHTPIMRYVMNGLFRLCGYNPFMATDSAKKKWDMYTLIVTRTKKST
jgi:ubiquinone/menaquinone biosynthesis C-methylase UbiE